MSGAGAPETDLAPGTQPHPLGEQRSLRRQQVPAAAAEQRLQPGMQPLAVSGMTAASNGRVVQPSCSFAAADALTGGISPTASECRQLPADSSSSDDDVVDDAFEFGEAPVRSGASMLQRRQRRHMLLQQLHAKGAGASDTHVGGRPERQHSGDVCLRPASTSPLQATARDLAPGAMDQQPPLAAAAAAAAAAPDLQPTGGKDQQAQSSTELQAEFQGLSLFDDADDDDEGVGEEERPPWYKRPRVWLHVAAFTLSALLLIAGILSQHAAAIKAVNTHGVALFRWFYFFGLAPVLWVVITYANNRLFQFVEWLWYRDAVFYLESVRRSARNLAFTCLLLAWFAICFRAAWCSADGCESTPAYKEVTDVLWKILICLMLFTLANFLKSALSKALSAQFYRTAHVDKVKDAIQQEFYLLCLSKPRSARPEDALVALPHLVQNIGQQAVEHLEDAVEHVEEAVGRLAHHGRISLRHHTLDRRGTGTRQGDSAAASMSSQQATGRPHGSHLHWPPHDSRDLLVRWQPHLPSGPAAAASYDPVADAAQEGAAADVAVGARASSSSRYMQRRAGSSSVAEHGDAPAWRRLSSIGAARPRRSAASTGKLPGSATSRVGSMLGRAGSAPVTGSAVGHGKGARRSDPLLQPGVLEAVNVNVDAATLTQDEWERLRTGIALKTFTALMKRYQHMSEEEEEKKLREARRFARGLFHHVLGNESRSFLIRDDFAPFFSSASVADQAFAFFDKDGDGQMSIREMKDSVTGIFQERKNMAASLADTDSIVSTLEFGVGCIIHFLFAAIYLFVFGVDIVKGFSTFSATVLALTFIFGNSARQIYESMLFLFVEHAFDVGDLLERDGTLFRVKKIDLMYTELIKITGERCFYPNSELMAKPLVNLTRTQNRTEKAAFLLDVGAISTEAREVITEVLHQHYEDHDSDLAAVPTCNFTALLDPVQLGGLHHMPKLQLTVAWTYSFPADDTKRTGAVRTALLAALQSRLGSLDFHHSGAGGHGQAAGHLGGGGGGGGGGGDGTGAAAADASGFSGIGGAAAVVGFGGLAAMA